MKWLLHGGDALQHFKKGFLMNVSIHIDGDEDRLSIAMKGASIDIAEAFAKAFTQLPPIVQAMSAIEIRNAQNAKKQPTKNTECGCPNCHPTGRFRCGGMAPQGNDTGRGYFENFIKKLRGELNG